MHRCHYSIIVIHEIAMKQLAVIHYTHPCFYCKIKEPINLAIKINPKWRIFHENYVILVLILFVLITAYCENVGKKMTNDLLFCL